MNHWPKDAIRIPDPNASASSSEEERFIPGIYILPNFVNQHLKGASTASELFDELGALPVHAVDQPIASELRWLPGAHAALQYRGHAVKRTKIWLQTDYDQGYLKYGYTGWQWLVTRAQRDVSEIPSIAHWLDQLNDCGRFGFNHVIATLYQDGKDNIGAHSDKTDNWTPDSWFCVIKLGAPRPFCITNANDDDKTVLFNQPLTEGTAVFVSMQANARVKHGVPPVVSPPGCVVGPSGSLVFRSIAERLPWAQVERQVERRLRKRQAAAAALEDANGYKSSKMPKAMARKERSDEN